MADNIAAFQKTKISKNNLNFPPIVALSKFREWGGSKCEPRFVPVALHTSPSPSMLLLLLHNRWMTHILTAHVSCSSICFCLTDCDNNVGHSVSEDFYCQLDRGMIFDCYCVHAVKRPLSAMWNLTANLASRRNPLLSTKSICIKTSESRGRQDQMGLREMTKC